MTAAPSSGEDFVATTEFIGAEGSEFVGYDSDDGGIASESEGAEIPGGGGFSSARLQNQGTVVLTPINAVATVTTTPSSATNNSDVMIVESRKRVRIKGVKYPHLHKKTSNKKSQKRKCRLRKERYGKKSVQIDCIILLFFRSCVVFNPKHLKYCKNRF